MLQCSESQFSAPEAAEVAESFHITKPIVIGERKVLVTGNSTSAILGQFVVSDESVVQSAQNAGEAVTSWLWSRWGIDLSRLHIHFQIRSILEGSPGHGVSGPSAGVSMVLALLSELSGLTISPSVVATGTIGVKLDVGPVGGLGGYGTQAGKIVGILKSRRVSDLILPSANFEAAADEMRLLLEEGIKMHPIRSVSECQRTISGLDDRQIIEKIKERFETAAKPTQPN